MKKITLALASLLALAFAGCSSGPAVMDKAVPEPERATLYLVGSDYSISAVDGKAIKGAFGVFAADTKGTGGGMFKKKLKPTVQIPSGTHKVEVDVSANCGSLNPLGGGCTPSVTHDFEPGKKYKLKYEMVDSGFQLLLSEITGEIPEE